MNLRIPGPTPLPSAVLEAMDEQMINHRGPQFARLIHTLTADLKEVFSTENDVLILTCSGTGGLEAAVVNTLSPGERTVIISIGVFGDRVARIAEVFGADVVRVNFPMGKAADPEHIREILEAESRVNTVFVTHNETSTGVTNDLATLSQVIKGEFDKTLVVDGISSIGSIPCPIDEWGIDIGVSGSQKGWMTPPGLAMISVSPRAWKVIETASMPRLYLDLNSARESLTKGQTPWTPGLTTLYGLRAGLDLLLKEGMPNVFNRHERFGQLTRKLVKESGLELFCDANYASNTLTAIKLPKATDWNSVSNTLLKEHKVILAGGQGPLSGKICRIGHLGWLKDGEIEEAVSALQNSLEKVKSSRHESSERA